jgi:hypothetical protein
MREDGYRKKTEMVVKLLNRLEDEKLQRKQLSSIKKTQKSRCSDGSVTYQEAVWAGKPREYDSRRTVSKSPSPTLLGQVR